MSIVHDSMDGYSLNPHGRLVRAGLEFFELLETMINEASHSIHLQTYIYDNDETGRRISKALVAAAGRNVKVFMVVDGYASQELPKEFIARLKASGIYFRFFNPVLKSKYFYFGRRLHHKIVVVDRQKCLVGGINIGNHYNDTIKNVAWLDWALYCEGEIGVEIQNICEARIKKSLIHYLAKTPVSQAKLQNPARSGILIRSRINDWVHRKKEVTKTYLEMLEGAQSHVMIISSYFLPGAELRKCLAEATSRGVIVKVIVAGISDVALSKNAERYMYRWLLRNKIEVFEYQRKILHAKLATADGKRLTIGSYNVNNISAYASVELNLDVRDDDLALDAENRLNRIIHTECIRITDEMHQKNQNLWNMYLQRSAYDIFRIILFIFTFYFKQRD